MSGNSPVILWFRRDLRLSDHPALDMAAQSGKPVIPLFIHDDQIDDLGAAPKWRLGLGVETLADSLAEISSRLILRKGAALDVLRALVAQTGAGAVYWTRLYDPHSVRRDTEIRNTLISESIDARSFGGHLMFEPWTVETKAGGYYKVYTPFWNAVKNKGVDLPVRRPSMLIKPDTWPDSDDIEHWQMGAAMQGGAEIVRPFVQLGEKAAQSRLGSFIAQGMADYRKNRDLPGVDGTSNLSENLALGEISPRQCWHAGQRALNEGKSGAETFLKELVWREFAYHLMYHTPHILTENWRKEWASFPWNDDERRPEVKAWKQGRTGERFVDAAMRELYVTGRMHNRGRMIVASYLTKHLMCHWRIGQKWFQDCLIDWDPASNALGWQWSAGSGPDATPYFRVFNPETQLRKFDRDGAYVSRWIAEEYSQPHSDALAFFQAVPQQWNMKPSDRYPDKIIALDDGRARALEIYKSRNF